MSDVTVHIHFFASLREQLDCSEETVTLPAEVITVGQLRQWLMARSSVWSQALSHHRNLQMAYQRELCDSSTMISDGSEIAFFPPVTGG